VVLLLVIAALAGGGYLWWQNYKGKPAYTLALIVDAVQRNDMKTFDSMVDTDKIVDNMTPDLVDKATATYGTLPTAISKGIQSLLPTLMPSIKQRVHDEVLQQVKVMSEKVKDKSFLMISVGMPWAVNISQTGDSAKVSTQISNRPVELTMQKAGDLWKIVGVKDDELTQKVVQSVTANLPSTTNNPLSNVEKEVKKTLGNPKLQIPQITLPGTTGNKSNTGDNTNTSPSGKRTNNAPANGNANQ